MFDSHNRTRRRLLKAAILAPAWCLSRNALAVDSPVTAPGYPERKLLLVNTHTGASLAAAYCTGGRYRLDVLTRLNQLLRDHRSGEIGAMDPRLFDLLHALALEADREPMFEVISGFRSAQSNAALRARGSGVARNSLHMHGKAIDVRMPGLNSAKLRDLAMAQAIGGVGYYRKSDFVHLDSGRFRSWVG